jgi:signal transduction histidine kinase
MDIYKKIKKQWDIAKTHIEISDTAFTILRIIVFGGGIAWLTFSALPQKTTDDVSRILIYFIFYCIPIYAALFFLPHKKRTIYLFSLFLDLSFVSLLVNATGGIENHSPFFNGFYLMTALYSFYYGTITGIIVAAIAAILYFISGSFDFNKLHWTDFSVRIAFLFLIALPLGLLSQKVKKDRDRIELLNKDLAGYIEELKYVQGKLIEAEKLSALGRLTADVAHEIRNPLTSIGGFAKRLNKKLLPGTNEKEYADIVVSEVARLERILKDVLTFSRDAKSQMTYQKINNAVEESLNAFSTVFNDKSLQIEKNLDALLPLILIDKDQVRQAVNNLLSNAVDATPARGKITVNTFMYDLYNVHYLAVEVKDTGVGITKEKMNMIFEPFYSTKEIGVGTGLGLSICRKIIEEHNGLIRVETEVGKGTSFKVLFPYQSKEEEAEIKCWEYMQCGVENPEGPLNNCPAYPNYGRICWAIAGTFCEGKIAGAYAQKLGDCKKCKFYQATALHSKPQPL